MASRNGLGPAFVPGEWGHEALNNPAKNARYRPKPTTEHDDNSAAVARLAERIAQTLTGLGIIAQTVSNRPPDLIVIDQAEKYFGASKNGTSVLVGLGKQSSDVLFQDSEIKAARTAMKGLTAGTHLLPCFPVRAGLMHCFVVPATSRASFKATGGGYNVSYVTCQAKKLKLIEVRTTKRATSSAITESALFENK